MKSFVFESGVALAVISKDVGGTNNLICLSSPVDWADLTSQFERALGKRKAEAVTLKAAVSRDALVGLRSWLSQQKAALAGELVLELGERRAMRFYADSGRLSIEVVNSEVSSAPSSAASSAASSAVVPAARPIVGTKPNLAVEKVVRVLIVDDSKAMRMVLRKILQSSPRLTVVGEAALPSEALKFLEKNQVDVLTLDIQMPEMSGVELFKKIRQQYGLPAVMVSALGRNEGHEVMDALEAGAFDYFQKPEAGAIEAQAAILHEKVILAAQSAARRRKSGAVGRASPTGKPVGVANLAKMDVLAIGASTGGTEAVRCLLEALPADVPPIVIVQHIPPFFSAAFAERLNGLCKFEVREARDGDEIKRGLALVAPGGFHLEVVKSGQRLVAKLTEDPLVNRFRPSVDVLFKSVAREFSKDASRITGIILTGMGNDGAQGLLDLRKAGARTIGQDEESSVVYGMPRAAAEIGACEEVAALDDMATLLTRERRRQSAS